LSAEYAVLQIVVICIFPVTIGTRQAFIMIETSKGGNSTRCLLLFLVKKHGSICKLLCGNIE